MIVSFSGSYIALSSFYVILHPSIVTEGRVMYHLVLVFFNVSFFDIKPPFSKKDTFLVIMSFFFENSISISPYLNGKVL